MISRISAATGAVQWTISGPHNSKIGYNLLEVKDLADGSSVLIAVTGTTTSRIYARLIV